MPSLLDRITAKVDVTGDCWLWMGARTPEGYGVTRGNGRTTGAHRVVYEVLVGPIPEGLTIDHLCRTRACVNPDHLEPVTMRENILRGNGMAARHACKTHCINGHPLSGENLRIAPKGYRECRACRYRRSMEQAERRREARRASS